MIQNSKCSVLKKLPETIIFEKSMHKNKHFKPNRKKVDYKKLILHILSFDMEVIIFCFSSLKNMKTFCHLLSFDLKFFFLYLLPEGGGQTSWSCCVCCPVGWLE